VTPPLPNFLVVGAMKCGTSSMARHLGSHPSVFMAAEKEVNFFDVNFDRGVDWYRRHFDGVQDEIAVGESTPYLYHPDTARRMASVLPDARLILLLRNPVDRAYSHYWHMRARGRETLEFADALDAEPERLTEGETSRLFFSYADRGHYIRDIRRLLEHYPRSALKVTLLEEMNDEAEATFRDVCRFLEVRDHHLPEDLGKRFNSYVQFRSTRVRELAQRLPGLAGRVVGRLNTSRRGSYPPMSPAMRERLAEEYRDSNDALARFLDRDLAAWNSGVASVR